MSHPLVRLSKLMNWEEIECSFGVHFTSNRGRPALSPRLVAGLLYLQHANDASDEAVVATWLENPYWQYFCGETWLQTELPIDPSSLSRWRKRIGEESVETLLAVTIEAARRAGLIKKASLNRIQLWIPPSCPRRLPIPTDSRWLEKSRQHLIRLADENNLESRQNYNRQAPRMAAQIGRYAYARQFKRMRKMLKVLRVRMARVYREVMCKLSQLPKQTQPKARELLHRVGRILNQRIKESKNQRTNDKNKLYALHAPEVHCISKGKARTPYEFGVKVSIATTLREGLVVGC